MLVRDAPMTTHLSEDDVVEDLHLFAAAGRRRHNSPTSEDEEDTSQRAGTSILQNWIKPQSSWEAGLDSLKVTDLDSYRAALDVVDAEADASTNPNRFSQAWDHFLDLAGGSSPLPAPIDPESRKAAATAAVSAATAFFGARMAACQGLLLPQAQVCESPARPLPDSALEQLNRLVETIQRDGHKRAASLKRWDTMAGPEGEKL